MVTRIQEIVNEKQVETVLSNVGTDNWVLYVPSYGRVAGDVHYLRRSEPSNQESYTVGLWRHFPEDAPEGIPFNVKGNETFHVIKGEAELTTSEGKKIKLQKGDLVSFQDGFKAHWVTLTPFIKFFIQS